MRTIETKVYQFDELDERAKERARDWFRQVDDAFQDNGAECIIDDAVRLGALIGIRIGTKSVPLMGGGTRQKPVIYWSGFHSQGDGASFSGSYAYRPGSVQALATEAPTGSDKGHEGNNEVNRIARDLRDLQRRHFYRLQANIYTGGLYVHSHTMRFDVERSDSVNVPDNDVDTLETLLRDFADWIYRSLKREYEYQQSDEQVDETIRANEYEFDEEGNRA